MCVDSTHYYCSAKEIKNTNLSCKPYFTSNPLPPEPDAQRRDAAVATAAVQKVAAARGKGNTSPKEGATHSVGPTVQRCLAQLPKLDHPGWKKIFWKCTFTEGSVRICSLKNPAIMCLKCFMYYANVNTEKYKAWVKAS